MAVAEHRKATSPPLPSPAAPTRDADADEQAEMFFCEVSQAWYFYDDDGALHWAQEAAARAAADSASRDAIRAAPRPKKKAPSLDAPLSEVLDAMQPVWSEDAVREAVRRLREVGVTDAAALQVALTDGGKDLNARLKDLGLRAFGSASVARLRKLVLPAHAHHPDLNVRLRQKLEAEQQPRQQEQGQARSSSRVPGRAGCEGPVAARCEERAPSADMEPATARDPCAARAGSSTCQADLSTTTPRGGGTPAQAAGPAAKEVAEGPTGPTVFDIIRAAKPISVWSKANVRAARDKLAMVGIRSLAEFETALESSEHLNSRIRAMDQKAFSEETLSRFRTCIKEYHLQQQWQAKLQVRRKIDQVVGAQPEARSPPAEPSLEEASQAPLEATAPCSPEVAGAVAAAPPPGDDSGGAPDAGQGDIAAAASGSRGARPAEARLSGPRGGHPSAAAPGSPAAKPPRARTARDAGTTSRHLSSSSSPACACRDLGELLQSARPNWHQETLDEAVCELNAAGVLTCRELKKAFEEDGRRFQQVLQSKILTQATLTRLRVELFRRQKQLGDEQPDEVVAPAAPAGPDAPSVPLPAFKAVEPARAPAVPATTAETESWPQQEARGDADRAEETDSSDDLDDMEDDDDDDLSEDEPASHGSTSAAEDLEATRAQAEELPAPPMSESWDWPMSRSEKKVRVEMFERMILASENQQLSEQLRAMGVSRDSLTNSSCSRD